MDDTLIFDILLTSGGIGDTYVLYPPESPETLERLLDAIECSDYDSLKKDCLVYFLLKWHPDGRERTFQEQRCIPPQFVALADAYWHLDTGINVPVCVTLNRTFLLFLHFGCVHDRKLLLFFQMRV